MERLDGGPLATDFSPLATPEQLMQPLTSRIPQGQTQKQTKKKPSLFRKGWGRGGGKSSPNTSDRSFALRVRSPVKLESQGKDLPRTKSLGSTFFRHCSQASVPGPVSRSEKRTILVRAYRPKCVLAGK
ncbi:hypothetical protein CEXT_24081 [Caerostris extrusa]|uniref:Uncharacterized protein n=1 Tax=Caerostris extrusa TaxID=172846 RepID=A0AAV4SKU7_CAEEX|nr:hypothetical protein CEXT_24081 [Caerostris extrusa]